MSTATAEARGEIPGAETSRCDDSKKYIVFSAWPATKSRSGVCDSKWFGIPAQWVPDTGLQSSTATARSITKVRAVLVLQACHVGARSDLWLADVRL